MTTIACVLRSGGDFTYADVAALFAGVERWAPKGTHRVLLTDVELPVNCDSLLHGAERRALKHNWPGWWSKFELFNLTDDVVICFDLDTVIVGDLQPLVDAVRSSQVLCLIRDFGRPKVMQSGIMAWAGNCDWPLRVFSPATIGGQAPPWRFVKRGRGHELRDADQTVYRGDGEWLDRAIRRCRKGITLLQDVVPGLYSYKHHVRDKVLPPDASVVCFHGRPRPRDVEPKPDWMT